MKTYKLIYLLAFISILLSCNNNTENQNNTDSENKTESNEEQQNEENNSKSDENTAADYELQIPLILKEPNSFEAALKNVKEAGIDVDKLGIIKTKEGIIITLKTENSGTSLGFYLNVTDETGKSIGNEVLVPYMSANAAVNRTWSDISSLTIDNNYLSVITKNTMITTDDSGNDKTEESVLKSKYKITKKGFEKE